MDAFKQRIVDLAVREHWTLDQLELAEDYIDARRIDRFARKPIGLTARNTAIIRGRLKQALRQQRARESRMIRRQFL